MLGTRSDWSTFNAQGRLIGIEMLDAAEVLRHKLQFEVELIPSPAETVVV